MCGPFDSGNIQRLIDVGREDLIDVQRSHGQIKLLPSLGGNMKHEHLITLLGNVEDTSK